MNKRKRLLASALLLLSAWTLSGCSALDQLILKRSGILDTAEYAHYLELKDSGQLSKQGYYVTDGLRDGVHVTFADNALLRIAYFKDKNLKESLSQEACYLQPGEAVYAQVSSLQDGYDCSGFQIYAFDKNGDYSDVSSFEQSLADGLVLSIPQNYAGTELSVMPVGRYQNRTITFSDRVTVEGAESTVDGGQWLVNGDPCEDNMVQISVASSAKIQYTFASNSYYLKESSPQCSEDNGILSFDPIAPGTSDLAYSVTLGKLSEVHLTVDLEKNVDDSVFSIFTSNGDNYHKGYSKEKIYSGNIWSIEPVAIKIDKSDLAHGEAFCFTVKREHDDKDTHTETLYVDKINEDINVPDIYIPVYNKDNLLKRCTAMFISISQVNASPFHLPSPANASLSVYLADAEEPLEDGKLIEDSNKVKVRVRVVLVPHEGYYLSGKGVKNNTFEDTMFFSDYKKKIDEILDEHPRLSYVHLMLETEEEHGTCTYLLDGKEIDGTEIDAREGQTLKLKYQLADAERYEIVRDTQGIGLITSTFANLIDESSAECEFSIKRDMDQTIISPSDYFKVKRREDK